VEIARAGSQTFDAIQINSWLYIGDRVRIEMRNTDGNSIFGAIDQEVQRYVPAD